MMSHSLLPLLVCLSTTVLLLAVLVTQESCKEYGYDHQQGYEVHPGKPFCSWKCLVFTLQWPGGFCLSLHNWTECVIPQNYHNWTIHGLWPLNVMKCCNCWPMFQSDVQEIEEELNEQWPSFLKSSSSFHFWNEEWQKHGVCAACVEGFNSPLRYFQICLKLRAHFDIHKMLDAAGITPSCERPYEVKEVHSILAPFLGDKHEIQCVRDVKGREVWFQVKIRLSPNLSIGCDHHHQDDERNLAEEHRSARSTFPGHPCPPQIPFYYFPINHEAPHQPCG
ncbi:ribonuclease Oy [Thalassophryne amazonica]|uniref:ribonuclease Oy n=1 Tax=Thalassophryne amazonica TaxID=390379 RepID=UPI0014724848|nr:ribonuclease Oy [Thalassophryne amazonica]